MTVFIVITLQLQTTYTKTLLLKPYRLANTLFFSSNPSQGNINFFKNTFSSWSTILDNSIAGFRIHLIQFANKSWWNLNKDDVSSAWIWQVWLCWCWFSWLKAKSVQLAEDIALQVTTPLSHLFSAFFFTHANILYVIIVYCVNHVNVTTPAPEYPASSSLIPWTITVIKHAPHIRYLALGIKNCIGYLAHDTCHEISSIVYQAFYI